MKVAEWCQTWLDGYGTRRESTVRQARVHIAQIVRAFGRMPLSAVRPSHVCTWTSQLRAQGLSESCVYALHARLAQVLGDAVHDGLLGKNPCSRRTSPGAGSQRPYVATTVQVWGIYESFPEHLAPAVLLAAFVGLRSAEACGLRIADVDFMRGVVAPAVQFPAEPLKTETSRLPVPIPTQLALELSTAVARWPGETVVTDGARGQSTPWSVERAIRAARRTVVGLPPASGSTRLAALLREPADRLRGQRKVVQARLRHASAKTTLDTYGHLFPDADESTRAAVASALGDRADSLRTQRSCEPRLRSS